VSRSTQWYETFFDGLYAQVLAGMSDEARNLAEARTAKRVLRLRKGQRVLDCPCGMGRITFALAKLGLDVTGADLTASYIRRARRQAKDEGLSIPFVCCDMRELPFEGQFDAVVNWFTSFGYFDAAGNLATAKAAFAALKPGGQYLIEILNKSWLLPRFTPNADEQAHGVRIVRHSRWDARGSRSINTWTMYKGNRVETRRFSHCLYTAAELRSLLLAAGFRDIRFFGQRPLGRLTRHSPRMIAIGTRPRK
jgi:SAM-dependent methyltransferase